jgi:hypothetical protein
LEAIAGLELDARSAIGHPDGHGAPLDLYLERLSRTVEHAETRSHDAHFVLPGADDPGSRLLRHDVEARSPGVEIEAHRVLANEQPSASAGSERKAASVLEPMGRAELFCNEPLVFDCARIELRYDGPNT